MVHTFHIRCQPGSSRRKRCPLVVRWIVVLLPGWLLTGVHAGNAVEQPLGQQLFGDRVKPFLETYCHRCHHPTAEESDVILTNITSSMADVEKADLWAAILRQLETSTMPPAEAQPQPSGVGRKLRLDISSNESTKYRF